MGAVGTAWGMGTVRGGGGDKRAQRGELCVVGEHGVEERAQGVG